LLDGASSSSSSESANDFLFLVLDVAGSGDECDEVELARPLVREVGLWWRLGVEAGGATKPVWSYCVGEKRVLSASCC
jgi:hypothetical protein